MLYKIKVHGIVEIKGKLYHKGSAVVIVNDVVTANEIEKHRKNGLIEIVEKTEKAKPENSPAKAYFDSVLPDTQESSESPANGQFEAENEQTESGEAPAKINGRSKRRMDVEPNE